MGDVGARGATYTSTLLHVDLEKHPECRAALDLQARRCGHSASTRATCPKFLAWCAAQLRCTTTSQGTCGIGQHAPLHPEKERILRIAPVQERGPTQHPTEREPPTHRNFGAGANRNVVDKNVRIVSPQTHTMDVALHWRTRGAAMTHCTHTSKCKAFGHHAQTRIHAPGTIASTWEYLAGQQHRCCRLEASSDAAAAEISNVKFVLPTPFLMGTAALYRVCSTGLR